MHGIDHRLDLRLVNDDFKLEFLQEFDGVLRAAVALHLSFLASKTAHLGDGHAHDAGIHQRHLHVVQLEGANDCLDFLHGLRGL